MRDKSHNRRLRAWDYSKGASFFITIVTEPRRPLFGEVASDGAVLLSPLGEVVQASLEAMPRLNPGFLLFGHVVMPDHVHFNCHLVAGLAEPLKLHGKAVRGFKAVTTRAYLAAHPLAASGRAATHPLAASDREASLVEVRAHCARTQVEVGAHCARTTPSIWQQGYHDHLCLSRDFIDSTERYIAYNGMKWALMYGEGVLRIFEPLASPRLDLGDYWKGVGNLALLDPAQPIVSLRVSREIVTQEAIAAVVARMERAVEKGYAVASGFVSKGEQAVRNMLCAKAGARLIHVRPSCIPNARFRPESAYVQAFAEGRCLELGKGNDEVAFGRPACLDVNADIIEMAQAGEGLSLYFRREGLYRFGGDGQWHRAKG